MIPYVKVHNLCGKTAKNKKNAKKNSTLIPIAKFCLYLHKIFRRFRFAETATPFFGLRRTQENDG